MTNKLPASVAVRQQCTEMSSTPTSRPWQLGKSPTTGSRQLGRVPGGRHDDVAEQLHHALRRVQPPVVAQHRVAHCAVRAWPDSHEGPASLSCSDTQQRDVDEDNGLQGRADQRGLSAKDETKALPQPAGRDTGEHLVADVSFAWLQRRTRRQPTTNNQQPTTADCNRDLEAEPASPRASSL